MKAYYVNLYEGNEIPEIYEIEVDCFKDGWVYFKSQSVSNPGIFFDGKSPSVVREIGVGYFQEPQEAQTYIRRFLEANIFAAQAALSEAKNTLNKFEKSLLEQ